MSTGRHRLVTRAIEAEQEARRRLAFELHDEVVQELLVASRELRRVEQGDHDAVADVRASLERSLLRLRGHLVDLGTRSIDHGSLVEALQHQAIGVAGRASVEVRLTLDPRANGCHEQLLYTVGRELLSNVERHADPEVVWVGLERLPSGVVLEVRDDGRGVSPGRLRDAWSRGHVGLAGTRERVEAIGGTMRIESEPGAGTRVAVWVPARRAGDGLIGWLRGTAQRR